MVDHVCMNGDIVLFTLSISTDTSFRIWVTVHSLVLFEVLIEGLLRNWITVHPLRVTPSRSIHLGVKSIFFFVLRLVSPSGRMNLSSEFRSEKLSFQIDFVLMFANDQIPVVVISKVKWTWCGCIFCVNQLFKPIKISCINLF